MRSKIATKNFFLGVKKSSSLIRRAKIPIFPHFWRLKKTDYVIQNVNH